MAQVKGCKEYTQYPAPQKFMFQEKRTQRIRPLSLSFVCTLERAL